MKKILYASKKCHVPYGEGGGETIAFDLLSEVDRSKKATVKALGAFTYLNLPLLNAHLKTSGAKLNINQQVVEMEASGGGKIQYPSFSHVVYQMPDSYNTTLARDDHYFISFGEYLQQFSPDVILLQAEGAVDSWAGVKNAKCDTYLYVQNGFELDSFIAFGIEPPKCLANSEFIQKKLKDKYKVDSELLYPAIKLDRYKIEDKNKPAHEKFTVLFTNPVPAKGLNILLHLVEALPEINFIVLEGWAPFSAPLIERFKKHSNVTCLKKTWNMAEVYAQADLLIVPSQWKEAFGRVVVEAHHAGVPTLVSKVGGLPEASGDAGLLIEDFKSVEAWERTLKGLSEHPERLDEKRGLLAENAQRFTAEKASERFMEIIS